MNNKWKVIGLIIAILFCMAALAIGLYFFGDSVGWDSPGQKIAIWLQGTLLILGLFLTPAIIMSSRKLWAKDKADEDSLNPDEVKTITKKLASNTGLPALKLHLRTRYGLFWRRKLRCVLVTGEKSDVEKVAPGLTSQQWLEGEGAVLIWGGSNSDELDEAWLKSLRKLCRRFARGKVLDAEVWVLNSKAYQQTRQKKSVQEKTLWKMHARNKILGWSAPLYLLDVRQAEWAQSERVEQCVGGLFSVNKKTTVAPLLETLQALTAQCTEQGMVQVIQENRHTFLLKLAQDLVKRDIPALKGWLGVFLATQKQLVLRGLLFSPVVTEQIDSELVAEHQFQANATWRGLLDDSRQVRGQSIGVQWGDVACWSLLVGICLSSIGMILSYNNNKRLMTQSGLLVDNVRNNQVSYAERLQAQYQLQMQISQLEYRAEEGTPWYLRFGLNQNNALLAALWPYYFQANHDNIEKPFQQWIENYLATLTGMSPADPARAKMVNSGYDVLRSYLMLSQPEKVEADLLMSFAEKQWPAPMEMTAGEWQNTMPSLMKFYGESITKNPAQKIEINQRLISDVRQIMINQIGLQNGETTIYQNILQRAGQNFANLSLAQLLNGTDSRTLFTSQNEIAGIFTRRAWEEVIEKEIEKASKSRQEEIDWVLADSGQQITSSISPEVLKQRLTDRYFTDYGAAWLLFLNNLQWQQADSVSEVIEQLTLLSDIRQSPLIALMNTVKYQAQVAYHGGGFSDTLVRSAKEMFNRDNIPAIAQNNEASGPLTPTFGSVLNLLNTESNNNGLSLQTYLLRVTQVRLKLQKIASSANPQAMVQSLAKSVFQGTSIDLNDTRDYGNLIAASLGEEWSGFGYSMFEQPLEQAWQAILTPAAKSFNDSWNESITHSWDQAFAGRYPFHDTSNEVSLPELSRFLRPDSGLIERFIVTQLGGVLHKQGDQWVPDPVTSQGLTFNPEFLTALNNLSRLSGQLFAKGDAGMSFELMPRSGHGVVKTELIIDKQPLVYFNQMPGWTRFNWPGETYSPGTQLSWMTDEAGMRLYAHQAGDWGWIRLLEKAKIRQIDHSRYHIMWKTEQNYEINYILRTQAGAGPLDLLKLKGFRLPQSVFYGK